MNLTSKFIAALRLMLALAVVSLGSAGATEVAAVSVTVSNLDVALDFYTKVLPFKVDKQGELIGAPYEDLYGVFGAHIVFARLKLGAETLELQQFLAPEGRAIPTTIKANDHAFQHVAIIVSNMARAYAILREHHVRFASNEPQRLPDWNPHAGGIEAFYFRDPDGHFLELLHFPESKGAAKWHQHTEQLFLGIDHTAIVVADTANSIKFYATLGLRVVGHSENYGIEQAHLNNVFGAHLLITALRGDSGPGIELLEYLAPTNGRPLPRDTQVNDLWHWHVALTGDDRQSPPNIPMPRRAISLPTYGLEIKSGSMVTDPDGHALLLGNR